MRIHRFRHVLLALALALGMGIFCPARGDNISQTANVSSAAGNVVFEVTAPSVGGKYGYSDYTFSQPWLSLANIPFPVSMNNTSFTITLAVAANTGAARTATFSCTLNGNTATFTVNQDAGQVSVILNPTSNFGPGNASEFYISASEKAFVAGVYDLHWSDFAMRSDGYYAYTNPNIVDREKRSGVGAPDHRWCVAYSVINAAIWGGWGYLGGYGYDEDLFGDAMIESGTQPDYYSSLQFVADVILPETEPYQFNVVCDSGFAQALQDHFASAEMMLVTQVFFDNYNWYGTTYPTISHGVTCCGYSLDTSKAISDPTCLKGLFIIDSENDRETAGGGSNAPDTMTYCPVSWDDSHKRYMISNVFGTTGYLSNVADGETYFFQCKDSYNLRKTTEPVPTEPVPTEPVPEVQIYGDSTSVGAGAGSVQFVLTLPESNTYSWDTTAFNFSVPWLTLAELPSRYNHTVYLTFNYEANTGTAAREAYFMAVIDNTKVMLAVFQAGVGTQSNDARKHNFGTVTETVGKIETSAFGTPTKARAYTGVVRDQFDVPVGFITVNVGKANNSGQCDVKATLVGLDGKRNTNAVKAAVPQSGAMRAALSIKGYGTLEIVIDADTMAGTLGNYDILPAQVGGALGTSRVSFYLEDFDWADSSTLLNEYLPIVEEFAVDGTRWVFDKAAVIKYKNGELDEDAYEKGLNSGKTNNSGLKLTYNARSGTFKGTFKVFSEDASGKMPKLKKTTVTVTGVVVDGYGYGQATIRNGGTYPVTIAP